eukprot:362535-Chlamydomonas_euryale.AAC.3
MQVWNRARHTCVSSYACLQLQKHPLDLSIRTSPLLSPAHTPPPHAAVAHLRPAAAPAPRRARRPCHPYLHHRHHLPLPPKSDPAAAPATASRTTALPPIPPLPPPPPPAHLRPAAAPATASRTTRARRCQAAARWQRPLRTPCRTRASAGQKALAAARRAWHMWRRPLEGVSHRGACGPRCTRNFEHVGGAGRAEGRQARQVWRRGRCGHVHHAALRVSWWRMVAILNVAHGGDTKCSAYSRTSITSHSGHAARPHRVMGKCGTTTEQV